MSVTPIFTCSLCGAQHAAVELLPDPLPLEEDVQKLRAAWIRADLLDKGDDAGAKTRHAQAVKASIAYFSTCFPRASWKMPSTVTTVRLADAYDTQEKRTGPHIICCADGCNVL